MEKMTDTRDGLWHAFPNRSSSIARVLTWSRRAGRSVTQVHRSYPGRVARFVDGRWIEDSPCRHDGVTYHVHRKPSHGLACAERYAAQLNRALTSKVPAHDAVLKEGTERHALNYPYERATCSECGRTICLPRYDSTEYVHLNPTQPTANTGEQQ